MQVPEQPRRLPPAGPPAGGPSAAERELLARVAESLRQGELVPEPPSRRQLRWRRLLGLAAVIAAIGVAVVGVLVAQPAVAAFGGGLAPLLLALVVARCGPCGGAWIHRRRRRR